MKIVLEINGKEDALVAIGMLNSYVGAKAPEVSAVVVESVEVVQEEVKVAPKRERAKKVVEETVKEEVPVVEEIVEEVVESETDVGCEPVPDEVVEDDIDSDTPEVDLTMLKELGIKLRSTIGVVETKAIISKYAPMLSEVKKSDYVALFNDLSSKL